MRQKFGETKSPFNHYRRRLVVVELFLRGVIMSAMYLEQITPVWNDFSKFIHVLHNDRDYKKAVSLLDSLID